MTTVEQIKILPLLNNISASELTSKTGQITQKFAAELKRNSISVDELNKICGIFNVQYEHYFLMESGEIIK